MSDIIFE